MPEERSVCAGCGRPVYRMVWEYELGRRGSGSAPFRSFDRWRHEDDRTLACDPLTHWGDETREFPDAM